MPPMKHREARKWTYPCVCLLLRPVQVPVEVSTDDAVAQNPAQMQYASVVEGAVCEFGQSCFQGEVSTQMTVENAMSIAGKAEVPVGEGVHKLPCRQPAVH